MKIIIQTYITVILLAIVSYISVGLILTNRQASMAKNFYANCIDNIENSGCDSYVILACQQKAEEYGYSFVTSDYTQTYEEETIPCTYVEMGYTVVVPFLNITETSYIKGYAK